MLMIYLFQKKILQTSTRNSILPVFIIFWPFFQAFSDLWVKELCCRYITNNFKITCSLYPLWFSKETCLDDKGKTFLFFTCDSDLFHMCFCFFIILGTFHALWMPLPLLVSLVVTLCFCLSNFKSILLHSTKTVHALWTLLWGCQWLSFFSPIQHHLQ